jgi:hypothetical protein
MDELYFYYSMTTKSKSNRRRRSYVYVPPSVVTADRHVREALAGPVRTMEKRKFLRAYCSFAYLHPGFHPDCWADWEGPKKFARLVSEAWRRAGAGRLTDNELYPYQAAKARILRERRAAGLG